MSDLMKPEHVMLLAECLRQERRLADAEPPGPGYPLMREDHEFALAHGPEYRPRAWFGPLRRYELERLRRGIDLLARRGLMVSCRRLGRRLSNVKLTEQGRLVAERLEAEQTQAVAAARNGEAAAAVGG